VEAREAAARAGELEVGWVALNMERGALETELARFPSFTAGRTVRERRRRVEVEARLGVLGRDISGVRMEMKKLGCI